MALEKPTKPTELVPRSFGGIKNNFSDDLQSTGFEPNIPQTYNGDNLNYQLNATGKELDYVETIADFINNAPINHVPFINENNQLDYLDKDSFGGGLEIGDIGIVPLGIDETKGKRRYLNGQIIIQDQYVKFTEKLKSAVALYSTLSCTESEWQAISKVSVGGQCGKFVIDDDAGTIRLPKIIMPIQGLTDLSKLAEIVEAGLPNHYHYEFNTGSGSGDGQATVTASQYPQVKGQGGYSSYIIGGTSTDATVGKSSHAKGSTIYGKSTTIQQEQIRYPYFIQVATGAETEDNIINEIELNNPFSLLDYKYSEYELNNISWLRSNGQFNSNIDYPAVYELLLKIYNGTETKAGVSVKLSTETYADTDFVLNPQDNTFRLPIKVKQKFLNAINGNMPVVGNGQALGFNTTNATNSGGANVKGIAKASSENVLLEVKGTSTSGWAVSTNQNYSGLVAKVSQSEVSGLYLYFYVGETVQNANLINAGRIEEKLASLIPDNSELISSYGTSDYEAADAVSITDGWTATFDCIVMVYWSGSDSYGRYIKVNGKELFNNHVKAGFGNRGWVLCPKGRAVNFDTREGFQSAIAYPLKGVKK